LAPVEDWRRKEPYVDANHIADMRTPLTVGASTTRRIDRADASWVYTPRRTGP
jgi:precorrin-3B methylase